MKPCFLRTASLALLTSLPHLAWALGNPEYNPATGVLALKAVDVNGQKTYENVEIRLDFATGQFAVVKASAADLRIPELAVQEVVKSGLKVGIRGCLAAGQSVTCELVLTSLEFNRTVKLGGSSSNQFYWSTTIFDNKGNTYRPAALSISNTSGTGSVEKVLAANVPTSATIRMENISSSATSFASLLFRIQDVDRGSTIFGDFEFKNISF